MESIDTAHLIYLLLLAALLIAGIARSRALNLLQSLQYLSAWALMFFLVLSAFAIWDDIAPDTAIQTRIEDTGEIVTERARDGHYHLTVNINGHPVDFLVDTGATDMVLTRTDAEAAGITLADLSFVGRAFTANGEVRTAPVRLETVTLGPFTDRNVYAVVNDSEMSQSLLGMGYLEHWGRIEIAAGELRLIR